MEPEQEKIPGWDYHLDDMIEYMYRAEILDNAFTTNGFMDYQLYRDFPRVNGFRVDSTRIFREHGATTAIFSRAEEAGYLKIQIEKDPPPFDSRHQPFLGTFRLFLTDEGRAYAAKIIEEFEHGKKQMQSEDKFIDRAKRKLQIASNVSGVQLTIKVDDIRTDPITLSIGKQHVSLSGKNANFLRDIVGAQEKGVRGKLHIPPEIALDSRNLKRLRESDTERDPKGMMKTIQNTISQFKSIIKRLLSTREQKFALKKSIFYDKTEMVIVVDSRLLYFQQAAGPKMVRLKEDWAEGKSEE